MQIKSFIPALFALHAIAAPTRYQPSLLPNTTITAEFDNLDPIPPSPCLAKMEGLLQDLTSSTLSILFGSTTTMLGYAFCGFTMPPETWESCTDFAVVGGSVVGLSHLAIWKFPQILNDLDMYESTARPWEDAAGAWGEHEGPNDNPEVKPREHGD